MMQKSEGFGLVANGTSGRWEVALDESLAGHGYSLEIEGPQIWIAVRVDILERLADLIRPALAWRAGTGTRPDGAWDGNAFLVTPPMMSILGATADDMEEILKGLGYRGEPKAAAEVKAKLAEIDEAAKAAALAKAAAQAAAAVAEVAPAQAEAVEAAVAAYAARYDAMFERQNARVGGVKMKLDASPRVVLVPGVGLYGIGPMPKDAAIAADLAENAIRVITDAEAIGRYAPLGETDLFDVEYWSLGNKASSEHSMQAVRSLLCPRPDSGPLRGSPIVGRSAKLAGARFAGTAAAQPPARRLAELPADPGL